MNAVVSIPRGERIVRDFLAEHGRAPTHTEYLALAKLHGGMSKRTITRHFGNYRKWLLSMKIEPQSCGQHSGNHLWQRLGNMSQAEFQQLAAEMFREFAVNRPEEQYIFDDHAYLMEETVS